MCVLQVGMALKAPPLLFHTLKMYLVTLLGIQIVALEFTTYDQTRDSYFICAPPPEVLGVVAEDCSVSVPFICKRGPLPKITGDTFVKAKCVPRGCCSCKNKNLVNQMCQSAAMVEETGNSFRWWRQNANHLKSILRANKSEMVKGHCACQS